MYTHPHTPGLSCPVCPLPDTSHMTFQKRKGQRTTPADYHATRATPVLLAVIMIKPHENQRIHLNPGAACSSGIVVWSTRTVFALVSS